MRCTIVFLFTMIGWFSVNTEQHVIRYDGHRVFRIIPSTKEHILTLKNIEKLIKKLDVWHHPHNVGDNYDVMVHPADVKLFIEKLADHGIKFTVLVDDVEKLLTRERRHLQHKTKRSVSTLRDYTTNFLSFPQVEQFLYRLKNARTEPRIDLISIGKSSEGRNLIVAKIYKPSRRQKAEIFIDAGIHAREWIAPATAVNLIYQLAFNPDKDPNMSSVLDKFDWYIMPVANPDGYQYTFDHDRLWRKTRNYNEGSTCRGVDANRNFNYSWDPNIGGSLAPCEDVFAGNQPFSVPESKHLGDFLRSHGNRIKLYLTMHSFGQYFLYPWGFSAHKFAVDAHDMDRLARVANRSMARSYRIGPSAAVLYPAAGGSYDYAKGAAGIKYSYTMELPPTDTGFNSYSGFSLPYDEIAAVAEDSWRGIKALALYLHRLLRQNSARRRAVAHSKASYYDRVGPLRYDSVTRTRTSDGEQSSRRRRITNPRSSYDREGTSYHDSITDLRVSNEEMRSGVANTRASYDGARNSRSGGAHLREPQRVRNSRRNRVQASRESRIEVRLSHNGGVANSQASRDRVRTSRNGVQPVQNAVDTSNATSSRNGATYSTHSGLNDYIQSLPKHMRQWFVQYINRYGK